MVASHANAANSMQRVKQGLGPGPAVALQPARTVVSTGPTGQLRLDPTLLRLCGSEKRQRRRRSLVMGLVPNGRKRVSPRARCRVSSNLPVAYPIERPKPTLTSAVYSDTQSRSFQQPYACVRTSTARSPDGVEPTRDDSDHPAAKPITELVASPRQSWRNCASKAVGIGESRTEGDRGREASSRERAWQGVYWRRGLLARRVGQGSRRRKMCLNESGGGWDDTII